MQEFPETRPSLLLRLRDGDREAWNEFSTIYRPLIYRLARRRGWQDADAQDLTQQVLVKINSAVARFRPDASRARFRTWLTTVCQHAFVDAVRQARSDVAMGDSEPASDLEASHDVSCEEILLEHRRQVFRWAAARAAEAFEETTWQAFWQTAVERRAMKSVAEHLGLTVGAVYTARSRVMRFLQQQVQEYDDAEV